MEEGAIRKYSTRQANDQNEEAYGYLLALRAVAAAAILNVPHAMLKVFCVLVEYANGEEGKELECYVGEHAIAARLNITRQAVNRQLTKPHDCGLIERGEANGRTTRYIINMAGLRDLKTGRAGWERVEERREQNRVIRRAARQARS